MNHEEKTALCSRTYRRAILFVRHCMPGSDYILSVIGTVVLPGKPSNNCSGLKFTLLFWRWTKWRAFCMPSVDCDRSAWIVVFHKELALFPKAPAFWTIFCQKKNRSPWSPCCRTRGWICGFTFRTNKRNLHILVQIFLEWHIEALCWGDKIDRLAPATFKLGSRIRCE